MANSAFGSAFKAARARGDSRFEFRGKTYSTKQADNAPMKQKDFSRDDAREQARAGSYRPPASKASDKAPASTTSGTPRPFGPADIGGADDTPDVGAQYMTPEEKRRVSEQAIGTTAAIGETLLGARGISTALKNLQKAKSLNRGVEATRDAVMGAGKENVRLNRDFGKLDRQVEKGKALRDEMTYGTPTSRPRRMNNTTPIPASVKARYTSTDDLKAIDAMRNEGGRLKSGGKVAAYAKGGAVSSRGDGIAQRGKTRCKIV